MSAGAEALSGLPALAPAVFMPACAGAVGSSAAVPSLVGAGGIYAILCPEVNPLKQFTSVYDLSLSFFKSKVSVAAILYSSILDSKVLTLIGLGCEVSS